MGALKQAAAEEPQIMEPLGRTIERHAHAIQQIDDLGRVKAHLIDRRLVLEEVAAVQRLVHVLPFAVALLAGHLVAGIDAALSADAVRALHWDHGKEIDADAGLGHANGRRQAGQTAANDNDTGLIVRHELPSETS